MEQDVGISEFMAEHGNYYVNWVHFEDTDMKCCPYLGPSLLNPKAAPNPGLEKSEMRLISLDRICLGCLKNVTPLYSSMNSSQIEISAKAHCCIFM